MDKETFSGSAQITDEGIKKHFKSFEPIQAIFELVWNGLDANANSVEIKIIRNGVGGLEEVLVIDDGDGIDVNNLENNFEKFNESSKKHDDDKHGSHGKGRLAFHKLCDKAVWYTKRDGYDSKIIITSTTVKDFEGVYLEEGQQHRFLKRADSGTCVELVNFGRGNLPEDSSVRERLSNEFGWFVALNKSISVSVNGQVIAVPDHDLHEISFSIEGNRFSAKVFRWHDKPGSEKSYNYLVSSRSRVIQKETSKFNNKVAFHTSAYVFSEWLDGYDPDALEIDPKRSEYNKVYKKIMKEIVQFQRSIYHDYLRGYVDQEIDKYDENGYFPSYSGLDKKYADWRKGNTKSILKDIYIADPTIFQKLNSKQSKIFIRLLDVVLVSNENDAVFDVLDGVLDLDEDNLGMLAKQLKTTTLENIISTIEILQKRQIALKQLREVMENRYNDVLETPDLQKIIESNTWLFGPQYSILGAEEDSFTKISKGLRDTVKDIEVISNQDIEDGLGVEGVNRQVDMFLARKFPEYDLNGSPIFKCVIVEIKRPGISLNKKHLQQLEDYAEIVSKHAAFSSDKMRFELILIGRKISKDDYLIRNRIETLKHHAESGLVSDGRIKCYVRDWFSIFDEFELSNNYLLNNLNSKLDDFSEEATEEIVSDLQKKYA